MKNLSLLLFVLSIGMSGYAQETFPVNDVKDSRANAYAFINATIHIDYQTKLENATLLIKKGKVVKVGNNISIPKGYTTVDLAGKSIYPSLIDMYTNYGMPVIKSTPFSFGSSEQIQSKTKGAYNPNESIKPEFNAGDAFTANEVAAKKLRDIGFGTVLTFRADGVARGTSAAVTLGKDTDNNIVIKSKVAANYALSKGTSKQNYPFSAMGFIALLRQTYLDGAWYKGLKNKSFTDLSLEAWNNTQRLPQVFETKSWLGLLRADKVGDEFGIQYIIKGSGDEYQRIDEVKRTNASLIVPINFPKALDVEDPFDAQKVSLTDMMHWELAPTNLGTLEKNNVNFAITANKTKASKFWGYLRKAIKNGLSEKAALKALTFTPAKLMRMNNTVGSLRSGMLANFIITSGSIFEKDNEIYENWIQGKNYIIKSLKQVDFAGKYDLSIGSEKYKLEISGKTPAYKASIIVSDSTKIKVGFKPTDELVTLSFNPDTTKKKTDKIRLSGWLAGKNLRGKGQKTNGDWISWSANYSGALDKKDEKKKDKKAEKEKAALGNVVFPFMAYGSKTLPSTGAILFKNATVWTNEATGILTETDVLVANGKISKIGKGLAAGNAKVIDATGKHLTAGIIDEHSHIALSSINDIATNSGMVRMGDVIKSDDINIYRQLAGGVTASQLLHGSANPIGGQSAIVKLRWGASPEAMKIKGADGFIKFALGENVKRSRSQSSIRYPLTRMGVEQVYMDAFTNALEYEKKWNAYNRLSSKLKLSAEKPRKSLKDETMLEIIRKKRFVTCHSYVQSEINMLMHVAEKFNFNINTFTHILEGYKVADKMKAHGAGGSTFADWWAYKWEVRYAIPYNATIMTNAGVTVAINSDDAEMGRRLNQEAAKSVKYGGMSEENAWKMVTLNPAKLLHLDHRMGSIKVGKDADVVLWSDNPLSIYAKAEKTLVDGKIYFNIEKDKEKQKEIQSERARLISKMIAVKKNGGTTKKPASKKQINFHCDDLFSEGEAHITHIR